jgi:hypothetical protein
MSYCCEEPHFSTQTDYSRFETRAIHIIVGMPIFLQILWLYLYYIQWRKSYDIWTELSPIDSKEISVQVAQEVEKQQWKQPLLMISQIVYYKVVLCGS